MFDLLQNIQTFNQNQQRNINPSKTWGLAYLQSPYLSLLNDTLKLTQDSVYHASPFISDRKARYHQFNEAKTLPLMQALPLLTNLVQQLKTDHLLLKRLDWETWLRKTLQPQHWQTYYAQCTNMDEIKWLIQCEQYWKIHQSFQYHSNRGLLFLLDLIIYLQKHFLKAYQELQQKQRYWPYFLRLPDQIAESYQSFLESKLAYLNAMKNNLLNSMVLRLAIVEQRANINDMDVSYFLAEKNQQLGFSQATLALPSFKITTDINSFNQLSMAIEKHGDFKQKKLLYRLKWYQLEQLQPQGELTLITLVNHRFLIPKALLSTKKKWFRTLITHRSAFHYLKHHQATLVQLALSNLGHSTAPAALLFAHSDFYELVQSYQLLQKTVALSEKKSLAWWKWQQNFWHKRGHAWFRKKFYLCGNKLEQYCITACQTIQATNRLPTWIQLDKEGNCNLLNTLRKTIRANKHSPETLNLLINKLTLISKKKHSSEKNHCSPDS